MRTTKRKRTPPVICFTVADVIRELGKLPPGLPVMQGGDEGVVPIHFNRNHDDAHLAFEENDGTWTDEP